MNIVAPVVPLDTWPLAQRLLCACSELCHAVFAGFPALVGLSLSKERYSQMRAAFDEDHVVQFLNNLMSGKEPLGPIRNMPTIGDAEPWDGKDGVMPKEEL